MSYQKYLFLGIPILFVLGAIFHYIYVWSGKNILVGLISPVNESVWEHLKLVLLPMTLYWSIYYFSNMGVDMGKWFLGLFVALISSMLVIVAFYYTYTQAFGIHSLALDVFSLLLGIAVGQFLGLHVYNYSENINPSIPISLIIILFILFAIFTFSPPKIPLFK